MQHFPGVSSNAVNLIFVIPDTVVDFKNTLCLIPDTAFDDLYTVCLFPDTALDDLYYLLFASFQILLYDIRSNKPLLLKDHMYGLPIRDLMFHESQDLVLSCDTRILKLWERETVSNALFTLAYLSVGREKL